MPTRRARCWCWAWPGRAGPRRWLAGWRHSPATGDRALALSSSQAATASLRERAELAATAGFEELFVHPHRAAAVRLLTEHSSEAGLDPFIESLSAAERLAMLLDRRDELPLRRHEIRGNAAGLLAAIVRRIDALKAAAVGPQRFREWAESLAGAGGDPAELDSAEREREFAEIYEMHDDMLREAGAFDGGGAVLALDSAAGRARRRLAATIAERFPHLIVDELEDACPAERALIARLAERAETVVMACDDDQGRARCGAGAELGSRDPGRARGVDPGGELPLRRRPARRRAHRARRRRRGTRRRPPGKRRRNAGRLLALRQRARRGTGRRARDRVRAGPGRGADRPHLRRDPAGRLRASARSPPRWRSAASPTGCWRRRRSSSAPRCAT